MVNLGLTEKVTAITTVASVPYVAILNEDGTAEVLRLLDGQWESASPLFNGRINALTVYNGLLVAGGEFTVLLNAGPFGSDTSAARLAQGNLSSLNWKQFALGRSDTVHTLKTDPTSGEVLIGGAFSGGLVKWPPAPGTNGYQSFGLGLSGTVREITFLNGQVIAVGDFLAADGEPANRIAAWDGASWNPIGSGVPGAPVVPLSVADHRGELFVGGQFNFTQGAALAQRSVFGWSTPAQLPNAIHVLVSTGDFLIAAGTFKFLNGELVPSAVVFDGETWTGLPGAVSIGWTTAHVDGNTLYLGRELSQLSNVGIVSFELCGVDEPEPSTGACCIQGSAVQASAEACAQAGGIFAGEGTPNTPNPCAPTCAGDLNGDGVVNVFDLLELLNNWGTCEEEPPAEGCGGPDAGSCFQDNGTPYCDDANCCEAVCACDPFCCENQWDSLCAGGGLNDNGCGAAVLCTP